MSGTLLYPNEYIHVLNEDSGKVRTVKGPCRVVLKGNERKISSITSARIVYEDQYAVIKNPYDEKNEKCLMGEREIRKGPCVIFLHYKEMIEKIESIHVLMKNQALRLQSLIDHEDKPAGTIWQIVGPKRFIPNKYTRVLKKIDAIIVKENTGIYVKNKETSEKKLIKGPQVYLLKAQEEMFFKQYTEMERSALGLGVSSSYQATVVKLKKGEVLCVLDSEKNEHVKVGPSSYIFGPEEHVKCLWLSAGKPKRPKCIKVAKVRIGPDFMSDKFEVRTKDNAQLTLLLTYKWEFLVNDQEKHLIFSMQDFIGYSCTTLNSKIREEAAKYNFEDFHTSTVALIRKAVFKNYKVNDTNYHGLLFPEIKLLISEVDVKAVKPVNPEINNLLNQSIKSNMVIVCNKMETEAELAAQKEKIKNDAEIQKKKSLFIDIQNKNLETEKIEKAKIDGKVKILKAKSQKESEEIRKKGKLDLQLKKMKDIIDLLQTPEGDKYLELVKSENFSNVNQNWYIASDLKFEM